MRIKNLTWVGAVAIALLASLPSSASAITINRSATNNATITLTATAGETNNITVTRTNPGAAGVYSFVETGATAYSLTGTAVCTGTDTSPPTITVTCNDAAGADIDTIVANLGDGNDTFTAGAITDIDDEITMNGDAGNDVLTGANSDGVIDGQPTDTFNGGAGTDRMTGLDGIDIYNGGGDIDRAIMDTTPNSGATVTIDGTANDNDGDGIADDNIGTDVESVTGSTLGDTITGSCLANTFAGSAGTANGHTDGNDTFNGDPAACAPNGTDFLGGGEGNDTFNCDGTGATPGVDTVTYGTPYTGGGAISVTLDDAANDNDGMGNTTDNVQGDCERIIGTANGDTINAAGADQAVQLFGRLGNDILTDGPGNDLLNGEGGTDTANCITGGTDTAISIETNNGCEL